MRQTELKLEIPFVVFWLSRSPVDFEALVKSYFRQSHPGLRFERIEGKKAFFTK
jgi:hypothetical protein